LYYIDYQVVEILTTYLIHYHLRSFLSLTIHLIHYHTSLCITLI